MIEGKVSFSEDAMEELKNLDKLIVKMMADGFKMFNTQKADPVLAENVIEYEDELDDDVEVYKQNHIKRMNDGLCTAEHGTIFFDMLTYLERVGDHINNVAFSIPKKNLVSAS